MSPAASEPSSVVAVRKDLDIFGVLVLAGVTGLGGGFARDVLIGAVPPAALADWRYLLVPTGAGLLTFWFHPALGRRERMVNVFDAAGLGLFCVTGALKGLAFGLGRAAAHRRVEHLTPSTPAVGAGRTLKRVDDRRGHHPAYRLIGPAPGRGTRW